MYHFSMTLGWIGSTKQENVSSDRCLEQVHTGSPINSRFDPVYADQEIVEFSADSAVEGKN